MVKRAKALLSDPPRRRFNPRPVLLITVLIDLIGFAMIFPVLPFLSLKFGASPVEGAMLVSIYSLMAFLSGPIWGRVSDRIGRRPTLLLTLLGATLGYIAVALAPSLFWLYAARAWSGAMAGNIGVVMAGMADITGTGGRAKAMGQIGAAFGLGFAIGPGLGGLIAGSGPDANFAAPFLLAAGLSLAAAILAFITLEETRPPVSRVPGASTAPVRLFDSWDKRQLLAMFFIANLAQSAAFAIIGFWADRVLSWDQRDVGLMMMVQGIVVAVLQGVAVDPLVRALGEVRAFLAAQLVMIAGCLALVASDQAVLIVLAFSAIIGGQTLSYPLLNSLQSKRTAADAQGAGLGLSNGMAALGRVFGPPLGGALLIGVSPDAPYLAVAGIGLIAVAWCVTQLRQPLMQRS
ncbi:MAG: MFS transporter [Rhodothalassiaceae bacterium]